MSAPSLSVVIPTQGRPTLRRAVVSIVDESQPEDVEIVVVADTHDPLFDDVATIAAAFGAVYVEHDAGYHGYGHPQLEVGYRRARGRWVAVLGDDDEFVAGALGTIVDVADRLDEPGPIIFRIEMHPSASRRVPAPFVIWRDPVVRVGNVSGQSIVLPNDPSRLAAYPPHATGDYVFIADTIENYGGADRVVWRSEVICVCR